MVDEPNTLTPTPSGLTHTALRVLRGANLQTLATTVTAQGLVLVSGIIAARTLGVEGRGELALLWLLPFALAQFGGLGLPQSTAYYLARDPGNGRGVLRVSLGTSLFLIAVFSVVYGVTLMLLAQTKDYISPLNGFLSLSIFPIVLFQSLFAGALLGLQSFTRFNATRILPPLLYTIGALTLLALGGNTTTLFLSVSAVSWLLGAFFAWFVLNQVIPRGNCPSEATGRRLLSFGARGLIGGFSSIDDLRLDQVLVGIFLDAKALGLYVSALSFSNLPRLNAQSIGQVGFSRVASASTSKEAWREVGRTLLIGVPVTVTSITVLLLGLPYLIPFFFGESFQKAIPIGQTLLIGTLFFALTRLLSEVSRGIGHPGYGSLAEIANVSGFLLGILFAGELNAQGVASALVVGGVTGFVLSSSLVIRLRLGTLGKAELS